MTFDTKLRICRLRLEGGTIDSVARAVGCSRQSVSYFLKSLPKGERSIRGRPRRSNTQLMAICADYLAGASIDAIAQKFEMDADEVKEVFLSITERKATSARNTHYPELSAWMTLNGYTYKMFSEAIGISYSSFASIINGRSHMRYELAVKIRDFTGLPFKKIYHGFIAKEPDVLDSTAPALDPQVRRPERRQAHED